MTVDTNYIGKVAYNVANRYFRELVRAISIYGPIIDRNEFDPELDSVNIMILLEYIPYDELIIVSSLEFDYQTILNLRPDVSLTTLDMFEEMYKKGYVDYVLAVHNSHYAYGGGVFRMYRQMGYKCTEEAILFSLERAITSFGTTLNSVLKGDIQGALSSIYTTIIRASDAILQKKMGTVPGGWVDAYRSMEREGMNALAHTLRDVICQVKKYIHDANKLDNLEGKDALEKLTIFMRDTPYRALLIDTYGFIREAWRIVKNSCMAPLDRLMEIILDAVRDRLPTEIEKRGVDPCPVVRIRKPGVVMNVELK